MQVQSTILMKVLNRDSYHMRVKWRSAYFLLISATLIEPFLDYLFLFFFHGPTDKPTFEIIEVPVPELKKSKQSKVFDSFDSLIN